VYRAPRPTYHARAATVTGFGGPSNLRAPTLSDSAAVRDTHAKLNAIWASLRDQGYALTNDKSIGLPAKFRENFEQTYFNDRTLRHDEGDWPIDRKRARDVIEYEWHDGDLGLREHECITLTDRAGIKGKREHTRVKLLSDPEAERLVRTFLEFVPPERRQARSTFGVNLFRTFTNVVTKPHHDDEEYIILYVINRIGDGAESYLYKPSDVSAEGKPIGEPILTRQLNPGDILIFEDKRFKHGATDLEPTADGIAMRDALVCTVDDHDSYLGGDRELLRV
jgi:hypothetical protein